MVAIQMLDEADFDRMIAAAATELAIGLANRSGWRISES